ncbi:UbiA family prenyltransferase [Yersinia frederiksenii]|uniref:UbiA family prenyltransferase n=1 Tax=Yersinia frederiksenii TaxID=29484 RepID=UPI0020A0920D
MLHESTLRVLRDSPWNLFQIPFWLSNGKAKLKQNLSQLVDFDPKLLPYNIELLKWLKQEKAKGRQLILCTASDQSIALIIAEYLGIFDDVMASDGVINLEGKHKAQALKERFGENKFDYVGNSNADLKVWNYANNAIVVNAKNSLIKKVQVICNITQIFPPKTKSINVWRRVLRVHQWLKNLLLFVPMLAAHQLLDIHSWQVLAFAFFSFSLCASSVYIANDLLDLDSDRQHPRKRNRPFAAGLVPAWMGVVLAPILFILSLGLGFLVNTSFLFWLVFYFILTCTYSWWLKRLIIIDCLTLALLYTLRIVAGAAAAGNILSFWLLAFSIFIFLSLAFVKRYAELELQLLSGKEKVHGRGYYTSDAPLIQNLGITSGYSSVVVLAFYLNSDAVINLYRTPEFIWGAVPIMLFWVSRMWMQAHRGKMNDDPLVFAVKDKASLLAGVALCVVLGIGTVGWPW